MINIFTPSFADADNTNAQNLTVNGAMNWNGGGLYSNGPGSLTVGSTGTLNLPFSPGPVPQNLSSPLSNWGVVNFSGSSGPTAVQPLQAVSVACGS